MVRSVPDDAPCARAGQGRAGRLRIIKVDVDRHGQAAARYGVQAVPTLMLFSEGQVLWRSSGAMDKAALLSALDPFLR